MDTPKELWKMITGNMALIQVRTGKGNIYSWGKPNFGSVGGFKCLGFAVQCQCSVSDGEAGDTSVSHSHVGPAGWTGCFHAGF